MSERMDLPAVDADREQRELAAARMPRLTPWMIGLLALLQLPVCTVVVYGLLRWLIGDSFGKSDELVPLMSLQLGALLGLLHVALVWHQGKRLKYRRIRDNHVAAEQTGSWGGHRWRLRWLPRGWSRFDWGLLVYLGLLILLPVVLALIGVVTVITLRFGGAKWALFGLVVDLFVCGLAYRLAAHWLGVTRGLSGPAQERRRL